MTTKLCGDTALCNSSEGEIDRAPNLKKKKQSKMDTRTFELRLGSLIIKALTARPHIIMIFITHI